LGRNLQSKNLGRKDDKISKLYRYKKWKIKLLG
jgi:hypothetical protein